MTLKGKKLLEQADVVVYDALISAPILAMAKPEAALISAGKRRGYHSLKQPEINALLIEQAQQHETVVRLKGGDPFVFGRGGEEMEGLIAAGIPVQVVPGITAGVAAPAYVGIPLTHRQYSSAVTFVTGHEAVGKYRPQVDWGAIARSSETIVVYMGIHNLPNIVRGLSGAGLPADTPIALVRWGTLPEQAVLVATLDTILSEMKATGFTAPAIAVIGNVVNLHDILTHCQPEAATPDVAWQESGVNPTALRAVTEGEPIVRME